MLDYARVLGLFLRYPPNAVNPVFFIGTLKNTNKELHFYGQQFASQNVA